MSNRPELTEEMEHLLAELHATLDAIDNDVFRMVPKHKQRRDQLVLQIAHQYEQDYYDGGEP